MFKTVSLIEVLWTLTGIVTLYYCGRSLRRATFTRKAIRLSTDLAPQEREGLDLLIRLRIWTDALFCYIQVGFSLIGFYAMTRPPAQLDPTQPQWGSILSLFVFVSIEVGCLVVSVWSDRLRERLLSAEEVRLHVQTPHIN